jgi:hypothetical protein
VEREARACPDELFIGTDASAEGLREASSRIARKPVRGGLSNALFGRLPLGEAPGALAGLADFVTVLLPWGDLLRTVARPEPAGLTRLAALLRSTGELRVLFGYDARLDDRALEAWRPPDLRAPDTAAALARGYAEAGLVAAVRAVSPEEVRALPTTWAKKLTFGGRPRPFLEIRARR